VSPVRPNKIGLPGALERGNRLGDIPRMLTMRLGASGVGAQRPTGPDGRFWLFHVLPRTPGNNGMHEPSHVAGVPLPSREGAVLIGRGQMLAMDEVGQRYVTHDGWLLANREAGVSPTRRRRGGRPERTRACIGTSGKAALSALTWACHIGTAPGAATGTRGCSVPSPTFSAGRDRAQGCAAQAWRHAFCPPRRAPGRPCAPGDALLGACASRPALAAGGYL